jgi:hypothetical protein
MSKKKADIWTASKDGNMAIVKKLVKKKGVDARDEVLLSQIFLLINL